MCVDHTIYSLLLLITEKHKQKEAKLGSLEEKKKENARAPGSDRYCHDPSSLDHCCFGVFMYEARSRRELVRCGLVTKFLFY